jgi:subtilisin family serine protease
MPQTRSLPALLVKARPGARGLRATLGTARLNYTLEPLFESGPRGAPGAAEAPVWHIAAPAEEEDARPWDLCHALMTDGFGLAGDAKVEFAEPDYEQRWIFEPEPAAVRRQVRAFAAGACEAAEPPDPAFPPGGAGTPFNWFLGDAHSGLAAARAAVPAGRGKRVRIAHLDTGYDPRHQTLPRNLNRALQRNFTGEGGPLDAADPAESGTLKQPGHGAGTLGILAGNLFAGADLGGAPDAEIVPLRVASSVVLFRNSAIARALRYARECGAQVVTMSMGGLASQAWADEINACYEDGVFAVTAAGNNFGNLPTRFIVYPARFRRVVAACGVMADGRPYADLKLTQMAGNYGPRSKMDTAMAAYTPNIPWPRLGCEQIVDLDGSGTSSATPQVAAAAALWLQKHAARLKYPEAWMRVEAVRNALFGAAAAAGGDRERLGRGPLRARAALDIAPAAAADLRLTPRDRVSFPFLRVITGLGAAPENRQSMLRLEAVQLTQKSKTLEEVFLQAGVDPDGPPEGLPPAVRQRFIEALVEEPGCSEALRDFAGTHYVRREKPSIRVPGIRFDAENPPLPAPRSRPLRVYAFDPTLGTRLDTVKLNQATLAVPWERDLQPGPIGEYLEVVDADPASGACYAPVDLNHPFLLAQDGLAPSESNPQSHQQMVYAVAMTTIGRFERALGRVALWSPRIVRGEDIRSHFVRRLRVYPHALREANAYYSPEKKALLFGYFNASRTNAGDSLPGGTVFTCLSHDVVAHEVAHALLDGLHRYYLEDSNPDVHAFHEAFADIVAIFQHFSMPEALRHQIARTRGDLGEGNLLAELARQFGQALGQSRALRDAVGSKPDVRDYESSREPHARGAVLVAAVFQAFLEIYEARTADLKRLYTQGTGVLPQGEIPADLVNRMAEEACKAASHVLNICIRALDYCPPVDITFGEYLRALITADFDHSPEDAFSYRVAFVSAFRSRGIFPPGVRNLSPETLRWQPPEVKFNRLSDLFTSLNLNWDLNVDRESVYTASKDNCKAMWVWLRRNLTREQAAGLGVYLHHDEAPPQVPRNEAGVPKLEIHSVRVARRTGPTGWEQMDLVVDLTQKWIEPAGAGPTGGEAVVSRGGCTLLIDLESAQMRYAIRKRVGQPSRLTREREHKALQLAGSLRGNYFRSGNGEPFAMLHRDA